MNRYEREIKNDWEDSWERDEKKQGNGVTPVQIVLLILIVLLLAVLIGMGVIFFTG
ncbi:MAG: hypothetical protein LUI87_09665 [Lachnospiraceae bacterium]|nr:hypothetical protein [Lachnospiraceae bacterium]